MREPPKILIVDDAPTNIEMVESVLAAEGFRTLTAMDGATAVALCHSERPDLILLDVLMPGESGFETCARLKSDSETAGIPVIFLSSLDDVQNKVNGLRIGGVDYISKPVHGEEVLARVRVHLRIRETNRNMAQAHRAQIEQLRDAQQAILVRPDDYQDAAFGVFYKPLEEVGGDFYDVVRISPGVYGYFVADISGHGVSASFLTSAVKALLRQYAGPLFSPEDAMRGVDAVMRQLLGEEQYLTACYASLNRHTRRLSVVSAGHPPLIVVRKSGTAEITRADSEPLGVFGSTVLHRKTLRVSPGDRFFLYSDGLVEAVPGASRAAGMGKLVDACLRHRDAPLAEAAHRIVGDLQPSLQGFQDDLVLLVSEVRL